MGAGCSWWEADDFVDAFGDSGGHIDEVITHAVAGALKIDNRIVRRSCVVAD
jgi:hypothetical protein